jgi:hypothetical protein
MFSSEFALMCRVFNDTVKVCTPKSSPSASDPAVDRQRSLNTFMRFWASHKMLVEQTPC